MMRPTALDIRIGSMQLAPKFAKAMTMAGVGKLRPARDVAVCGPRFPEKPEAGMAERASKVTMNAAARNA